jgi:hypothetical protein
MSWRATAGRAWKRTLGGQRDHPAAVDVPRPHPRPQLGQEALGLVAVGGHHLGADVALDALLGGPADQHRQPPPFVGHQQQPELHAGEHAVAVQGTVDPLHRSGQQLAAAEQAPPARPDQVAEPEPTEALVVRDADRLMGPPRLLQPGIQGHLEVGVLGGLVVLGHDRQRGRVGAEVVP